MLILVHQKTLQQLRFEDERQVAAYLCETQSSPEEWTAYTPAGPQFQATVARYQQEMRLNCREP